MRRAASSDLFLLVTVMILLMVMTMMRMLLRMIMMLTLMLLMVMMMMMMMMMAAARIADYCGFPCCYRLGVTCLLGVVGFELKIQRRVLQALHSSSYFKESWDLSN